jgi:hypothetical protein
VHTPSKCPTAQPHPQPYLLSCSKGRICRTETNGRQSLNLCYLAIYRKSLLTPTVKLHHSQGGLQAKNRGQFSTSSSSTPNFLVLLILSNRGGNWRAVSGLFSKKLLNSIIFTNIRRKNNFSIFFINLFYEMKRNSYDRLRKVVVSGWFVGLCGFFSVCFFFSF